MRLYYCLHIELGIIKSLVSIAYGYIGCMAHRYTCHCRMLLCPVGGPGTKQAMVDRMYLSVLSLVLALGMCLGVGAHHDGQHHHHSPDDVEIG